MHAMGTSLEGETADILAVVGELHAVPFELGIPRVYTVLKLDERRDKAQTLEDKVASVQRLAVRPAGRDAAPSHHRHDRLTGPRADAPGARAQSCPFAVMWRTPVAPTVRGCSRSTAASGWSRPKPKNPKLVPARGRLTQTPVTGDVVLLDEAGAIAAVEPRRGTIVRRAPGRTTTGHVLAANVDLALVTEPLPDPKARRLERFAALAAVRRRPVALALTKADLVRGGQITATRLGRRLGVADAVAVSALTGEGMGILRALLAPGTTTVLLGASGTGKSTLVNALLGEQRQKTGEVRASDGRGRHTTVTRELLTLPGGAHLIDTPGIRIAGLWDGTGETLRRRRRARAAVPLRRLRPRHRAGLRREGAPRPGADRRLAQAAARARLGRGPPRRRAGPRPAPQGDHALAAVTGQDEGSGGRQPPVD